MTEWRWRVIGVRSFRPPRRGERCGQCGRTRWPKDLTVATYDDREECSLCARIRLDDYQEGRT